MAFALVADHDSRPICLVAVMEAAMLLEDAAEDELAMRQHELDAAEELALELA